MPRTVAIVFEPDYSAKLAKTAFVMPVWLADTPANRSAAEDAWREAIEWPHISVTLFRPPDSEARREHWLLLLEQVALLEKHVEVIDVVGLILTDEVRTTLAGEGFGSFEETASGFRARRI